tara:strand:- start:1708 stop:2874 length:1167 start_codon:yes stop_codon:yes gene_type:complete
MPKPIRKKTKPPKKKKCLWNGPVKDGVTNSLLTRFSCCRERFRLYAVEGLREDEGYKDAIEWGNFWHEAEEALARGIDWKRVLSKYQNTLRSQYGSSHDAEIRRDYRAVSTMFPLYIDHWKDHGEQKKMQSIFQEASFRVPYNGIVLRGKWDSVYRVGKSKNIYLMEHKTKGRIDEHAILKTLSANQQTMIYQITLQLFIDGHGTIDNLSPKKVEAFRKSLKGCKVQGVLYNVILRPKIGQYGFRQRKGRVVQGKLKGAETEKQFYNRVSESIAEKSNEYFFRWKAEVSAEDRDKFCQRTLDPILTNLKIWWASIEDDPFNPWESGAMAFDENGEPVSVGNDLHWQAPWGSYNSLAGGFRGDYFEYLTDGSTTNLKSVSTLYPELDTV